MPKLTTSNNILVNNRQFPRTHNRHIDRHRSIYAYIPIYLLVSKSHILITESIDTVTNFLQSLENLISSKPVTVPLQESTGSFWNGANLLSL